MVLSHEELWTMKPQRSGFYVHGARGKLKLQGHVCFYDSIHKTVRKWETYREGHWSPGLVGMEDQ